MSAPLEFVNSRGERWSRCSYVMVPPAPLTLPTTFATRSPPTIYSRLGDVAAALGQHAHAIALDVTSPEQMQSVVQQVKSDFGALDFFFNNAGISSYGEASDLPFAEWER